MITLMLAILSFFNTPIIQPLDKLFVRVVQGGSLSFYGAVKGIIVVQFPERCNVFECNLRYEGSCYTEQIEFNSWCQCVTRCVGKSFIKADEGTILQLVRAVGRRNWFEIHDWTVNSCDINFDNIVDTLDMQALINDPYDWNNDGFINSNDITDYLNQCP